ncbi:hypothetical protein SDC9_115727 [bioreactor metagenome]|uniref:Uncharacterized protein n=1 Tax=bioreactor metagenome TaxID=1076179 RepID=A0A645C0E7_9ZZZZ
MSLHQSTGIAGVGFQVQHAIGVRVKNRVALHLLVAGQTQHGAITRGLFALAFAAQRGIGHELQRLLARCGLRRFAALFLGAHLALRLGLLAGRHIGVDVRFDHARLVHLGGIQFEPALLRFAAEEGCAAHVGDLLDRLARGDAVRHLHQRALGVAVQQDVALAVHHDGAAHLVAPIVIMRNAAQAALNAAQHDGHVLVGLAAALAVDDGGAVRALAAHVAGRVGVVTADLAVRRVAVDHRIHVARRHAPEQVRTAQRLERLGALPVRLRDDAHAKALGLQHAADHGHAEAGVVHIGITRHQDHIA